MSSTRTIYHFEDEGRIFQFLPEALWVHYWRKHLAWKRPNLDRLADKGTCYQAKVELFPPGHAPVVIEYKLFQTKELFQRHCTPQDRDLVLIDVMRQRGNNDFTPDGLELFQSSLSYSAGVTVWVVTGYANKFREWVETVADRLPAHLAQTLDDWLFIKPIDSVAFVAKMARTLHLN
jgi:hypothetical protein